jgi:hypothetical protein
MQKHQDESPEYKGEVKKPDTVFKCQASLCTEFKLAALEGELGRAAPWKSRSDGDPMTSCEGLLRFNPVYLCMFTF